MLCTTTRKLPVQVDSRFSKLEPGALVGQYTVIRRLKTTDNAETYLAVDSALDRKVALKMLPARVLANKRLKERFFVEAQIMAKFNHPNIAAVYNFGEHSGSPYLALEFVEGWTLNELMRQKKFSIQESMRIGLAIARALSTMHERGVLHRDLKPGNIMILHNGNLRLKDFGFAEVSPALLAASADIWALGSILCLLLGGIPPFFTGLKEIPVELESLVAHCLDNDPWNRPSAAQVAGRLCSAIGRSRETTEKESAEELRHSICCLPLAAL